MRLTIFWERMADHFGEAYADSFARDHVMAELGGRTVHEALAAGWEAKDVWRGVCAAIGVPAGQALSGPRSVRTPAAAVTRVTSGAGRRPTVGASGRDLSPWHRQTRPPRPEPPVPPAAVRRPHHRVRRPAPVAARMPRWLPRAMVSRWRSTGCFQLGSWAFHQLIGLLINILIAFFLALAIEPAVEPHGRARDAPRASPPSWSSSAC